MIRSSKGDTELMTEYDGFAEIDDLQGKMDG